jgi:hypothetical protein
MDYEDPYYRAQLENEERTQLPPEAPTRPSNFAASLAIVAGGIALTGFILGLLVGRGSRSA